MKNLDDGIRFPSFLPKKLDLTEPVQFEPVFCPVRLIFHKINVIRFGWFFESKPNRTVNTPTPKVAIINTSPHDIVKSHKG